MSEPRPDLHTTLADFHTDDEPMRTCLHLAEIAARTDLPVLILGETGTGKSLLARILHNSSMRARDAFVEFNAAALSDTLLDSQLFGHERGAFTGAERRVKGKFELADGGTLFVDEIADMSAVAQAKILRAIEYGEFERLGSEQLLKADVRLVSATHLPIARFLETDHFRKDLFYRVSGITLRIPPLRDRPNDLRTLIAREISAASVATGREIVGLSRAAADRLMGHSWPGNLRELKRVVHTAVAVTEGTVIEEDAVLLEATPEDVPATGSPVRLPGPPVDGDLSLRAAELRHIRLVLERLGGNKRRAARALGLSRSTLDRKLQSPAG
jgi:transcriptional regulator with PAS, ATPase and Fis domain